ncbi:MAG: ABC transporter substrate-binding protein [Patescibacteria group bacterium]
MTLVSGILGFIVIIILSSFIYFKNTEIAPTEGGEYTEGLLGSPRFLNPIYSQKSEVDKDLTEILYSGLMHYGEENKIEPLLAESVETEDNRRFEVTLKDDIYWSDGEEITTEDIEFTLEMIQSRNVQSPLRVSWEGVRIEKENEKEFSFLLENASPLFIEKLTLKPIPEHVWSEVSANDFQFSEYNLNPVTSGPYKVKELNKNNEEEVRSITLTKDSNFFGEQPYINNLNFKFFKSEKELLENKDKLDGFALPSIQNNINSSFNKYNYNLPRYFALFFNSEDFNKNIRKALRKATNKEDIVNSLDNVDRVDSPIIPSFYNFDNPEIEYEFNKEEALELFEEEGYALNEDNELEKVVQEETSFEFTERLSEDDQGEEVRQLQKCLIDLTENHEDLFPNGEMTGYFNEETEEAVNRFQELFREDILDPHGFQNPTGMVAGSTQEKLNEFCGGTIPEQREQFTIEITTINHPLLSTVIEKLSEQWSDLGIKVDSKKIDYQQIQSSVIEEKNYESFLFGISMEAIPDPFRWWHSSQVDSPGLNFTNYQNEKADEYLTNAVTSTNEEERIKALNDLQNQILEDVPAIFLYSPHYIYLVSDEIKGLKEGKIINTSQRFKNINNWHINTKRVWKNN